MRICLVTHVFPPSVGGIEHVAQDLAYGFAQQGHEVVVVTSTPCAEDGQAPLPFRVLRQPTHRQLASVVAASDVVLHNNPVTRWLWASVICRTPTVLAHHCWIIPEQPRLRHRLKRLLIGRWSNIAVSEVLRRSLPTDTVVIPNGYDATIFYQGPEPTSDDLLFVGRLVTEKGMSFLLSTLSQPELMTIGLRLRVVGDGPELQNLQRQAHSAGLGNRVAWLGHLSLEGTAREMRSCRVLVAPSSGRESFGLVALEAVASGCTVVAPLDTGLEEAAGPALVPYRRGDAKGLTAAIVAAANFEPSTDACASHLQRHSIDRQVGEYLTILESKVLQKGTSKQRPSPPGMDPMSPGQVR